MRMRKECGNGRQKDNKILLFLGDLACLNLVIMTFLQIATV
jgi:hypothetical protein